MGVPEIRTGKRAKIAGNLLHVSSYWALNNIHTERWSTVGWKTRKTLPFCLVLFCWHHAYVQKIPGSPRDTYSRSRRAWERGYICSYRKARKLGQAPVERRVPPLKHTKLSKHECISLCVFCITAEGGCEYKSCNFKRATFSLLIKKKKCLSSKADMWCQCRGSCGVGFTVSSVPVLCILLQVIKNWRWERT